MALSKARGKGLFEMADQSSTRICLHLGAVRRSHSGVDLMRLLSFAQFPGCGGEELAKVCEGREDRSWDGCSHGRICPFQLLFVQKVWTSIWAAPEYVCPVVDLVCP